MAAIDWTRESGNKPGGADPGAADDAAPAEARARAAAFSLPALSGVASAQPTTAPGLLSDAGSGAPSVSVAALVAGASGATSSPRAAAQSAPAASAFPFTSFSMNLATGQNAAGVIQTSGDLADAHWTVSNADNYKQAPIAFTVAPNDPDWFSGGGGNPGWLANGPNSSWIAADPDVTDQGFVTYTVTFDLTGYNPADATLVGGEFTIDDQGIVLLNGHEIGSDLKEGGWSSLHALSNGAGDFVAGINTIVIETTNGIIQTNGARFEGTVVDTVTTTPPGPDHWTTAVSGDFATAANWSGGFVPSATNDAILDAAGSNPYTVTSAAAETVGSIQTASNATLDITAGVFQAQAGTGAGANAGTIEVGDGAGLSVAGTVDNTGIITLAGNGAGASLIVAGNTTLTGAGQVTLSDSTHNAITGGGSGVSLTNSDNTISGAGTIGGDGLTSLVNGTAGVIDATGANRLVITTGSGTVINDGLIEATGAGGIFLESTTLNGSEGGTLIAGDGSRVILENATLTGGTLETAGSGLIRTVGSGDTLTAVVNTGALRVAGHSRATLQGFIGNLGQIQMRGFGVGNPKVFIGVDGVTLSGSGRISTGDNAGDTIRGASADATLTNLDNTIVGAGLLGGGKMALVNAAAGVIDGDDDVGLTIDTGTNTVANAGLIEATRDGRLTVTSALDNTGTLLAGVGCVLTLDGDVTGAGTATIHNGTIDAAGAFSEDVAFVAGSGRLDLAFSQSYGGTISGFSRRGGTSLDLGDIAFVKSNEATWSDGVLTVTDGTHTAQIDLTGNFGHHSFVASDDGHGGTLLVATARGAQSPAAQSSGSQAHRFAAAMASLAHPAGTGAAGAQPHTPDHLMLLTAPRLRYA